MNALAKFDRLQAAKERFAQVLDADVVKVEEREKYTAIVPAVDNSPEPTVYVRILGREIEIGREYVGSDKAEVVRWLRAVANQIEALS